MVDYFSVTLTVGHDRARLRLRGELDIAGADELLARFHEACASEPSLLLIDLAELSFCDCSGIRVLLMAAEHCREKHIDIRLVGMRPNVRRTFELTHTAEVLHLGQDGSDHAKHRGFRAAPDRETA